MGSAQDEEAAIVTDRGWKRKAIIGVLVLAGGIGAVLAGFLATRSGDTATLRGATRTAPVTATPASGEPRVDYTLDLRTGRATPLPDSIVVSVVDFGRSSETKYAASSDGSMLAYVGLGDDDNPQIFVAGLDGRGIRQLTHDVREAMSPAWSPDGATIAYVGYGTEWTGNRRRLFVVDVATGASRRVTGATDDVWGPQFRPDGRSILYSGGASHSPRMKTVPVSAGKSAVPLEPGAGLQDAGDASLSPDGSLVTFLGGWPKESGRNDHCGPCRFVAKADGTKRRVINGGCWGTSPAGAWSPDGTRIVCSDDQGGIVLVDVETGTGLRVARGRSAIWLAPQTLLVSVG
jgi:Tol biopolymer transport system component